MQNPLMQNDGNLSPHVKNVVQLKVEGLMVVTTVISHIGLMGKCITPIA